MLLVELLVVGKRATEQRLRLGWPVRIPEQAAQLIAGVMRPHLADHIVGIGGGLALGGSKFGAQQRLGFTVACLRVVDFDELSACGACGGVVRSTLGFSASAKACR